MSAIRIVMGSLRDARVRLLAVLGVAGLAAGAGVLTAGAALAGVGSQPGSLELLNAAGGSVITSGSLSSTPSWQTTSACPSGFQSSASISEFYNNGTSSTIITSAVNAGLSSSTGFGPSGALGTFEDTVGGSLSFAGISGSSPGTAEWVVGCYGPSGGTDVEWTQSVFVSVAAGATTYTTSSTGPTVSTATAMTLSAPKAVYGREQTERVSVAVSASSGTPTGSVAVTSGTTRVCTITLASGAGSCTVGARQFAPGSVRLTASYAGSSGFSSSASSAGTFTVSQAKSKASLTPSAAKVTYGHEESERLSVKLSPQYSGTPAGTVAIKAGRTTVCVIKLRSGKGTCTLSAKELPAGTYHLLALYAGNSDLARSASPAKTVKVVK
jgi:hypothetical protein